MGLVASLGLAGCGGSGGDDYEFPEPPPGPPPPTTITISGTVQKGLFDDLDVSAFAFDDGTGGFTDPVDAIVTDQDYSVEVESGQLTLLEATGSFTSEFTGETVVLDEPLMLLLDTGTEDIDANINLATTLSAELALQELTTTELSAGDLIEQQDALVGDVLGFADGTDPSRLDFNDITDDSDLTDPNLALLIYSGGVVQQLESNELFAGGFGELLDGILAADTLEDAQAALSPLSGLSAGLVYDAAVDNSGYTLPQDLFGGIDTQILTCIAEGTCDWETAPAASVSVSGARVWEASGRARISVRLGEAASEAVTVEVAVESDTATSGEDFIGTAERVTIPAGQSIANLEIPLIIDALAEGTETIAVTIASQTAAYPVYQGSASVSVRNGAPSTLDNQAAADIQVMSFELARICNPLLGLSDASCAEITGQESGLGFVEGQVSVGDTLIDLAADCPDPTLCTPQASDWRVDFFLVAESSVGTEGEVPLGPYIYRQESLQLVSEAAMPRTPLVRLDDAAVATLAADAQAGGWDLSLEARVGANPQVADAIALPSLITVPDTVLVGDTELGIVVVSEVSAGADAGCAESQYAIDANYAQAESPLPFTSGQLCVDFDAAAPDPGPAVLVEGQLDAFGGTAPPDSSVFFLLPDGVYSVLTADNDNEALRDESTTVGGLFLLPAIIPGGTFINELHAEGWPFTFRISRFSLTPAGLEIGYSDMRYIMDPGYSSQDPRSRGGPSSNDVWYRAVAGSTGSLILGPDGIDGDVTVPGGGANAGRTAFPKARTEWQTFTQTIDGNALQPTTVGLTSFALEQRTSCTGPDCVSGEADEFTVTGSSVLLDGDGYLVGDVTNSGSHAEPRFGARADGTYAWARPDDLTLQQTLKLALAGYVIPDDGVPLSGHLLAHLNEPAAPGNVEKYPAGSDAFVDGNYHPAGLSIGPEIYRDGVGIPQTGDGQDVGLLGTALRLDNGVDSAFSLDSAPAVKYVIRNAGITGVFNVRSAGLGGSAPQFYGYDLDLTRFAVRAVDNVLDDYTWIDGRLALQGDAGGPDGLDIHFTNLEIDCSARLGNVDLVYERCEDGVDNNSNGFTDENCSPVLYSWKAPTDIFAAGFDGGDLRQACAVGEQDFFLQHQMNFAALDKPVAFDTFWDPAGTLSNQRSGELATYRFDRSEEGQGFPVRTDGAELGAASVDGEGYGWLTLGNTQVGVPFWNSLEADLRVANQRRFSDIAPEPTVVLPKDKLASRTQSQRNRALLEEAIQDGEKDDSLNLTARYEWGRTGFGFQLPVFYQPWQLDSGNSDEDARGRQSRFLGRDLPWDLFVLEAHAGINFIEPDRTKLSFGASADFTRLEGLSIQVDITDPDSAAAVDRTLEDLGIIDGPLLEPALTDFLDTVNVVNRYASRGMDELLQTGLETGLEKVGEATAPLTPNGQDPFVTASELLAQVQGVPQQAIGLIRSELQQPLASELFGLEQQLRTRLAETESTVENLPDNLTAQQLESALAPLAELENVVDAIAGAAGEADDRITDVVGQIRTLRDTARDQLAALRQATFDVDLTVSQAVSFVDSACANGLVPDAEGNGYLNDVAVRFAAVRRVATIIRNTNQLFDAAESLTRNDDVRRRLVTARQRIRNATEELLEFVKAADEAVQDVICNQGDVQLVTARVFDLTKEIRDRSFDLQVVLAGAEEPIERIEEAQRVLRDHVLAPLNALRAGLDTVRDEAENFTGPQLRSLVECVLYNATHSQATCSSLTGAPAAEAPWGINAIAADDGNADQRDLADLVFGNANNAMGDAFDEAERILVSWTDDRLPGAYMSPEELRRMLATEILRTAPVRELRLGMDRHFGEIGTSMNGIVLQFTDQLNEVIREALASVAGPVNDALAEATAVVRAIPLQAAEVNGFATIAGNELERAHISAGWTMRGSGDGDSTRFGAALDAESWSARHIDPDLNTPTACAVGESESLLDVKISAYGLPINVLAADITIEKLYLGFTLQGNEDGPGPALLPIGVFGGINTIGEIGFSDAIIFDPGFAAGLGELQTYVGATAGASFSGLTADVAFLVGRVCPGNTVLTDLDPQVEKYLPSLPASGFIGAYMRGGATIPIIPGGCALNVGVSADFGQWIFVGQPTVLGGLVGGGAVGQVGCIASIKGKVTVGGSVSTDGDLKLTGEAWGVAGVGFDCDPGTWTSVPRSRNDSWCGTGDVQFRATFDNGNWLFDPPSPQAIF
ncbi:Calx-beta domain-containing protein [Lentisalinibacter sediminis]|uniref:Calx-beta domain-containing protein n=1 Tax=Lentisalinibacter sediminis TaxID=2992237 RepID=UPI00386B00AC